MLKINGKTFMNIQEAVQWLLDNNALPFQSSANYIANTEIGMGTIVNPSPAKVRIGSLIFFADSKVSTVTGLTENGFIVSDQYNNLVDDIAYVTSVTINASGHLITALSDGQTIDAGIVKQISSFSINASQHLIANYNDGTTTDVGAIFSGNVNVAGNFTADSIIENMSGYSFTELTSEDLTKEFVYVGAVKNGNKVTLVLALNVTKTASLSASKNIGYIAMPSAVMDKLYPTLVGGSSVLVFDKVNAVASDSTFIPLVYKVTKNPTNVVFILSVDTIDNLPLNTKCYIRIEQTFLLSDSLAS